MYKQAFFCSVCNRQFHAKPEVSVRTSYFDGVPQGYLKVTSRLPLGYL